MLLTFATISRSRRVQGRRFVPLWIFLAGYLTLWMGFSLAATLAQWGLHSLALISPMMVGTSPLLSSLLLITAGVYQWTPLDSIFMIANVCVLVTAPFVPLRQPGPQRQSHPPVEDCAASLAVLLGALAFGNDLARKTGILGRNKFPGTKPFEK